MTEGASPALTHGRVLSIAIPIMLSNVTVPLLGAVDTGVVGQLGAAAPIGAVGIGSIIITAVYWFFGFLRMGTTGLASQALGAGDRDEVSAILVRALLMGLAGGFFVVLAQWPLLWAAFALSPASGEVETLAHSYVVIRIFSAPAAISIYGLMGWLIAREQTRSVLVLQVWMNGLNVVLDLWFVLGLGWGVEGVAFATFIAEWSGLALGLILCRAGFRGLAWRRRAQIFDGAKLRRLVVVNRDIMVRTVLLQAAFISFMFLGAGLGDVTLAANQVLMQFLYMIAFALDGFALAAESLVGQAMGAENRADMRRAVVLTSAWGLVIAAVLSVVFMVAGHGIIALITTAPDVRNLAGNYLIWLIIAPVIGVASWMLDGVFIGATRTGDMRRAMFLSTLVYGASVGVLLPLFGNHGLWAALMIFFIARAVTLAARYPSLEAAVSR